MRVQLRQQKAGLNLAAHISESVPLPLHPLPEVHFWAQTGMEHLHSVIPSLNHDPEASDP